MCGGGGEGGEGKRESLRERKREREGGREKEREGGREGGRETERRGKSVNHYSTLSSLIDSPREQIQDAVAVYFVRPTRENIDKICQDCQAQLYSSFYFNFISPISRSLLEDLARAAVTANCVDQIAKVNLKNHTIMYMCI